MANAPASPEDPSATLAAPQADLGCLRDYRLVREIARGGMGVVYEAIHIPLDCRVALKVLHPERTWDREAIARFTREMRAIGKLDHPNIVRAQDAGEADGKHFLVMEFIDGLDLASLANLYGPLPVADVCELIRQAASGLAHAHGHGLVHRDVKPSNIIVTGGGIVKVLDFGLAMLSSSPHARDELTVSGQIVGTPEYMAPEQVADSHAVDARVDVYGLGATMYRLLTGFAPHSDQGYATPAKKLMAVLTRSITPVAHARDDIPLPVLSIVDRLLAKDPDQRLATVAEVAEAIAPHASPNDLRRLVAAALQKDPSAGTLAPASTLPHITSPQIDTHVTPRSAAIARNRGSARRRKSVQAIGMLLMLVALVLAVLAAFQGSPGGVTDRDRSAAEWVLADRNSIVWVRTDAAASAVEVDQLDELPQGPFDLIGVIAAPGDAGVPRSLDALRGLEHLNSVELYFRLEEGSVEILAGLPQLRQLTLGGFGLTGAELRPLRSHPALIQLLVGGNPIEDQYVADLAAIENLQVLGLWDTQITDAGVKSLTAAQSLEALSLDRTSVTDKGLQHLNSLDRLTHLSLDGVRGISGEGLASLVRDSKILSLNLKSSPVTNAGLQSLAAAGRLEQLDLTGNRQFTDASMQHIAQITTLRELNISWTSISNEGVRTLRSLRYLANLQLAGAAIDDDCVPYLLELSSLTELNLEDTRITRAGYDQLKEELPSCVIYWRSQVE